MNFWVLFILLFLLSNALSAQKKKVKKQSEGYMTSKKALKADNPDYDKLHRNSTEKEKPGKTDCPDKSNRRENDEDYITFTRVARANIVRSTSSVHFNVVEFDDIHLDIPSFKMFKNNMTDFTADGEHEFNEILHKIDVFLGKNHEGRGVKLKIIGSASQIPTSFDPAFPNNNIRPDGGSILGKTSIENNKKLAKARADELAKKIQAVFPSIKVETPTIDQIELGKTKWTTECQRKLYEANQRGDKEAVQKIYEPFQKDQWVKVESKEKKTKQIQPESLKMYMMSTTPSLKTTVDGQEITVKTIFIISKNTFEAIGDHKTFASVEERDEFISKLGIEIYHMEKNGVNRWYMLRGEEEIKAFQIEDYNTKIYALYKLDIVDNMDDDLLEEKIIAELQVIHSGGAMKAQKP